MPIINTLLTARDTMSNVLNGAADNARKAGSKITGSLDDVGNKAVSMESIFQNMRNGSVTSFSDMVEYIDNIKTTMAGATTGAARFAVAFTLISGGVAAVTAALIAGVSSAADYVREMGQIAKSTNSTVEWLQQMKAEFISTGMEIDKFGDINKDVLDHLGDGFRDGSGPSDDMKALGLNVKDYNKYLNDANGGTKALIHTFFELRSAGKNMAEITNMMETLASDGSHLASTLSQYGSETEAVNHILNQHAGITQDTIDKYAEWDKNVSQMTTRLNEMKVNSLGPVVDTFNEFIDVLTKDEWTNNDFNDFLLRTNKLLEAIGLNPVFHDLNGQIEASGGKLTDYGKNFDYLSDQAKQLQSDMTAALNPKVTPTGGWEKPDTSKPKTNRFAQEQQQAKDWLTQLDANIALEQDKAAANYQIQLKKLDGFHAKKLISEREYQRGVEMLNTQMQKADIEQIYQNQMERLNSQHEQMLMSEEDFQSRMHQIQAEKAASILDANFNQQMEKLNYEHDAKLVSEEDFQAKLLALQMDYDSRRKALTQQTENIGRNDMFNKQASEISKYNDEVNRGIDLASGFADIIRSSAEEGSAAWVIATVAQKALMVSQAIMAANLAAVTAAASTPGGPVAQMAAATNIQMWGYAQAALIAAQGIVEVSGARATGGGVDGGKTYLVGEKGPELFTVPGSGGQITSNANLQKAIGGGKSGGDNYIKFEQSNVLQGSGIGIDDMQTIQKMTESIVDKKFAEERRNNS